MTHYRAEDNASQCCRGPRCSNCPEPAPIPSYWPSISEDEETVRAAIQAANRTHHNAYESLARLVVRAAAGGQGVDRG